jgi:hypothetical protein
MPEVVSIFVSSALSVCLRNIAQKQWLEMATRTYSKDFVCSRKTYIIKRDTNHSDKRLPCQPIPLHPPPPPNPQHPISVQRHS